MKKLLSVTLALVLALSLCATAFAEGDEDTGTTAQDTTITASSGEKTGKTAVNYNVTPAYTVTIPPSVTIDSTTGTGTASVSAEGVKVLKGQQVVVKLTGINESAGEDGASTSSDKFVVKTTQGAELEYTVKAGDNAIAKEDGKNVVLTVKSGLDNETDANGNATGASTGSATLTFTLTDTVKYAGEYSGTVTFTVAVEAVTATTP